MTEDNMIEQEDPETVTHELHPAVCLDCGQTMNEATGCTADALVLGHTGYYRLRFGRGDGWNVPVCPDCGTHQGQVHHYGCDIETCPKCGSKLVGCTCFEVLGVITLTASPWMRGWLIRHPGFIKLPEVEA